MVGELFAVLAGWPHRFLGELIGLVVLSVPFCVQHAIQKRKARSYARLLARVR
jgi:heme A synthase